MAPSAKANADGTYTLVVSKDQALAIASGVEELGAEEGLPVLEAIVGSATWLRAGGEGAAGVISRAEYETWRSDHGLPIG